MLFKLHCPYDDIYRRRLAASTSAFGLGVYNASIGQIVPWQFSSVEELLLPSSWALQVKMLAVALLIIY